MYKDDFEEAIKNFTTKIEDTPFPTYECTFRYKKVIINIKTKSKKDKGWQMLVTPVGTFKSRQEAATALGITKSTISYRRATKPEQYYYV